MRIKFRKKLVIIGGFLILIIFAALTWYNTSHQEYVGLGMRPDWDIADNIVNASESEIFALAIYNTKYTTFLHGEGPYTVFVPTDIAYSNLSPETRAYFANRQNQGEARHMLLYHVVKGKYIASDIKEGMKLKTVQGEELAFSWKKGYLVINGYAYVQTPNVISKNGVIHITTNYLIPPSMVVDN